MGLTAAMVHYFRRPPHSISPARAGEGAFERACRPSLVTFCLFVQEAMLQSREIAMTLPLAGMRVLDVSQVMTGPFCCMLLGDLGADVIKVEPPDGGDHPPGHDGIQAERAPTVSAS